jgi:hypothetical protein
MLAAVRRHANAFALVMILILISIVAFLTCLSWDNMFGTLYVNCQATVLEDYWTQPFNGDVPPVVNMTSGGRVIGQSFAEIRLMKGQYALSFPNYQDYEPPENQTVVIEPHKRTEIQVYYRERKGYIVVSDEAARYSYFSGVAFIDNHLIGNFETDSHKDEVIFVSINEAGNHTVSIGSSMYTPYWQNQTVTLGSCGIVGVDVPVP